MLKATVAQPFVWRDGHKGVLIGKGEQMLTLEQLAHAEKNGFLQKPKQVQLAKKESAKENTND